MKNQNVRWKQIVGGIFVALALGIYALYFFLIGMVRQAAMTERWGDPAIINTITALGVGVIFLTNWPSVLLLGFGAAWFWNSRPSVRVWCYRISAIFFLVGAAVMYYFIFRTGGFKLEASNNRWNVQAAAVGYSVATVLFYWRSRKRLAQLKKSEAAVSKQAVETPQVVPQKIVRKAPSSFASCNILQLGGDARHLWHFESRAGQLVLQREQPVASGQAPPPHLVAKTWRTLWQKKLNIGWLPPEKVFLRALQLPKADFSETLSMVEFQLEKISPLPVAQVAWSVHVLPAFVGLRRDEPQAQTATQAEGQPETPQTQTIIVTIVSRALVEEFLGNLEQEGFLADRLEVPMLDKLATTPVQGDGAWVYPDAGNPNSALVAWWYGGALQSLGLIQATPGAQRAESLREQFTQMAWAGELEGWLTSQPRWHLVADAGHAAEWQAALQQALDQPVEIITPQTLPALALATARRAAHADPNSNLLPQEHALRYRQQFVDRLWMRGIGAVVGAYVVGVLIYFVALQVLTYKTNGVEQEVAGLSQSYTNAKSLKQRYEILKERDELKFAPLECWKATAEHLPSTATLQTFDFIDGKKLTLRGMAPADKVNNLYDFNTAMQKVMATDGKPLFAKVESLDYRKDGGGNAVSWNFTCELKYTETR